MTTEERETLVHLEAALASTKPTLGRLAAGTTRPRRRIRWAIAIATAGLVLMVATFAVHLGLAAVGMVMAVAGLALLVDPIRDWVAKNARRRERQGT